MSHRGIVVWLTVLVGLALVPFPLAPEASAAVQPCSPADVTDANGDQSVNPGVAPEAATGFSRIDLRELCVTETADGVHFVLTVGAAISASSDQSYTWTLGFAVGDASGPECSHTLTSGGGTDASQNCTAEIDGARIQFTVLRTDLPPGSDLSAFVATSSGRAVTSVGVATASDRMPDSGEAAFEYVVGTRAPPESDYDGDGVPDAQELERGSDPAAADTDGDGLDDGAEDAAGSDPLSLDTDGDGLLDGAGAVVAPGSEDADEFTSAGIIALPPDDEGNVRFAGEADFGTDPLNPDTDGDGLGDGDEVSGVQAAAAGYTSTYLEGMPPGATDPNVSDSDGDGLADGEEVTGQASIDGQVRSFPATNPNHPDTDADGLSDYDEVRGLTVTPAGIEIRFSATDPTNRDTDGDGFTDFSEVADRSDPDDSSSQPNQDNDELVVYLPLSLAFLAALVLVSFAGILWRWG